MIQSADNFYSRASCEARPAYAARFLMMVDISTHAPHARRGLSISLGLLSRCKISTHAPHARRGDLNYPSDMARINFYSRASCEARPSCKTHQDDLSKFLLTRLMRGAAEKMARGGSRYIISTHAPHARRGLLPPPGVISIFPISTHAPHARRGVIGFLADDCQHQFLLTRLMRGAAFVITENIVCFVDFYSRASCEARRGFESLRVHHIKFLLTRLMRGAA